jgi:uncharacterized protein YuzE
MDRPNLKSNKPHIKYDKFSDVLYISLGNPCDGLAKDIGGGNFIRINPQTNEVIGITILDFMERYSLNENTDIQETATELIPTILKLYTH